jgi:hypothetical protein
MPIYVCRGRETFIHTNMFVSNSFIQTYCNVPQSEKKPVVTKLILSHTHRHIKIHLKRNYFYLCIYVRNTLINGFDMAYKSFFQHQLFIRNVCNPNLASICYNHSIYVLK